MTGALGASPVTCSRQYHITCTRTWGKTWAIGQSWKEVEVLTEKLESALELDLDGGWGTTFTFHFYGQSGLIDMDLAVSMGI